MTEKNSEESYSHILKYTGIFGGVQGLNILIGLVRNKLVAILLGPGGMGLASLFNTTINFISQATNLGISFSAVRHVSELFDSGDRQRIAHFVKVVRGWSLLTALAGMLVCIVVGPLLSRYTFSWGDHTLHFVLLAPTVAMIAVTGGETAILKGARQLKSLAGIQIASVFAALLISMPIYYFFGETGIVPVITLMALAVMLLTLRSSFRLFPYQVRGAKGIFGEGMEMVKLGVAFTLAGIIGTGAEMFIRSFLNVSGNLDMLGLYNAGYMLTVTYAGMVFSAMETDYFPRLSAVNQDIEATNNVANQQMAVSLLIISPMLVVLIVWLPLLIPLMFSNAFLPVIEMAQTAALAMYMRVLTLPVAYITLARGYSLSFLLLDGVYYVVFVLLMMAGFNHWGLLGAGVAITVAYVFDFLLVLGYAYWRYQYRMSPVVVRYAAFQIALGVATYALTLWVSGVAYWLLGSLLMALSAGFSLYILKKKTNLWQSLMKKIKG
ncbi:MAG: oligosaccharide flippase family protein [Prevotella sp.]|nr:oligosaccharide flippase family protein [Prevotella sp.]